MKTTKLLLSMVKLALPMWGWMLCAILLGVAGFVAASAIPTLGAYGLGLLLANSQASLTGIIIALVICSICRGLLRYGEQACNHYIAFKLLAQIRDKVFGALRKLAPAKLEGRNKGDLISMITGDVELLEVFYAHTISPICIAVLCSLIFAAFGFSLHWSIGLLLLVSYLFVGLLSPMIIGPKAAKAGQSMRDQSGKLGGFVLESTRGIFELLQFGQIPARIEKLNAKTDALYQEEKKMRFLQAQSMSLVNLLIMAFGLAMVLLCGHLYTTGQIQAWQTLVAVVGQLSTFGPVVALANLSTGLSATLGAGQRVLALLEEKPQTEEVTNGNEAQYGSFELNTLDFSYQDGTPVLEDLNLTIEPDQILGISGPSGCGKSTLLRLLMRFWDPTSGSITLAGQDLKTTNTKSLRDLEGCVLQDTILFADTIEENLKIAKADATMEEMVSACKKAAVHDLILSLPQGYQTPVAEMGSSLSAGERQRLGLARAFLHNSKTLLLDEPTSNLDSLNEGAVLKAIVDEKEDRTIVLISHRKGTLGFADRNIKMADGKVLPQNEPKRMQSIE